MLAWGRKPCAPLVSGSLEELAAESLMLLMMAVSIQCWGVAACASESRLSWCARWKSKRCAVGVSGHKRRLMRCAGCETLGYLSVDLVCVRSRTAREGGVYLFILNGKG